MIYRQLAAAVTIAMATAPTERGRDNSNQADDDDDRPAAAVAHSRFTAAGKVGVWTKADSRILFDDLNPTNLGS